ncbi:MAG TPA: hydantoinase B/oxoprolinase family protein, partial [Gemmatimonadaceae bacterium]|nr:hydantoinase B/oxoprolinase family protein [Gemmatimonadaceae bacterium]
GRPASPGRNLLNDRELPPKCRVELQPGDVLTIETPGGGGWGER